MPVSYSRFSRLVAAILPLALAALPAGAHNGADAVFMSPELPAAGVPQVAAAGTVEELIVDNRVSNTTTRYVGLRLDDGRSVALVGAGLDALAKGTRVEAIGRTAANTLYVTEVRVVAAPPVAKASVAGSRTSSAQGTLTVFHSDFFAQEHGKYGLVVQGNNGVATPLNMAVVPDTLRAGMSVIAGGTVAADGFALDVSTITVLANAPANFNATASAPITNNVLVMPIKFSDSPVADPFTPAQIDQVMRTNSDSVAAYYNEVSYGQQLLNITVACSTTVPAGCASNTSVGGWLLSGSST
ncbi:MAG TPA: hypothetical protein VEN29_12195, partial [Casimicrobiaceae bacterium]|nr:hypothetical protein [Casimicrobiaceae bacterium]